MLGRRARGQLEFFVCGSLRDLVPDDHVLARVDRVLDLGWLHAKVSGLYAREGRPGIDPEAAVRLMLAGFLLGIVHDRRLLREAQVNLAIRWFAGYGLQERLPDHSSLTRRRQRWGAGRFRRIFERTVKACIAAGIAKGEIVHADASLIRADLAWESLARRHVEPLPRRMRTGSPLRRRARGGRRRQAGSRRSTSPIPMRPWRRPPGTAAPSRATSAAPRADDPANAAPSAWIWSSAASPSSSQPPSSGCCAGRSGPPDACPAAAPNDWLKPASSRSATSATATTTPSPRP
jgi:transposase